MSEIEPSADQPKSEDKKNIELEEKDTIINAENEGNATDEKKIKDIKEGMEVKPKKIPIGGIQMPGFFMRSKSKEQCKENTESTEGAELIESANKEEADPIPARIKLPNPFRKSKTISENEDVEKNEDQKDKKKLLETIRLPLVSVFSQKKKNLNVQSGQAELASVETLDETTNDSRMKNVPLGDKEEAEKEIGEELTWIQRLKTYKVAVGALLLFLLFIVVIVLIAKRQPVEVSSTIVRDGRFVEAVTSCGNIEGLVKDSAIAFRGVPYARPPVGDLRFKYAKPLNKIEYCWNGTYLAHNATPPCLQVLGNGTVTGTEDCLTLDVVTPYVRYDNPLPVVVLVGADSLMGDSPGKMRPSARYARTHQVVFVRPNFRLGALGFLALDTLSTADYPKTSGNYGLSDLLEALRWVQLNIVHFNGNKDLVTVFGHKAGATLVTALGMMPDAHKYFARAWVSSGSAIYPKKPRTDSELDNKSFLEAVQCKDFQCLLNMDAEKLITAIQDTWRKPQPDLPTRGEDPAKKHQWLVLDGVILKDTPEGLWAQRNASVKLVVGAAAQGASTPKLLQRHLEWTKNLVQSHINSSLIGQLNLTDDEAVKTYPPTYAGLTAMISDIRIVCPLLAMSQSQQKGVSFYVATHPRGRDRLADIDSDIDSILGRYEPKTPEQRRYNSAMQGLFYHYVWHGEIQLGELPNRVLVVDQDVLPQNNYSQCDYWKEKGVVPRYAATD